VYEENQQLTASPEIAAEIAKMDYQLKMAAQFSKSGAFPKMSPEQIYTVMKSGEEMGLKPIEALQTLYVVNGSIKPYGDKMIAMLRKKGYKIEYVSEDNTHCLVRIFNKDETYSETARADDPVLRNSKAMKFAPKQKLRFHAVRQIVSFHLPHLFFPVSYLLLIRIPLSVRFIIRLGRCIMPNPMNATLLVIDLCCLRYSKTCCSWFILFLF